MENTDRTKQIAYLVDSFGKNPTWQSEEILASRASHLKIASVNQGDERYQASRDHAELKSAKRQALHQIRDQVWTASKESLRSDLEAITLDEFPELERQAERLRIIVENREQLEGMKSNKDFNEEFFHCMKLVMTSPPKESAEVRERVLISFGDRKLRKSGLRMVRMIQKETPALFAIEAKWFSRLFATKSRLTLSGSPRADYHGEMVQSSGTYEWQWWHGLLVFLVIKIAVAILRGISQ